MLSIEKFKEKKINKNEPDLTIYKFQPLTIELITHLENKYFPFRIQICDEKSFYQEDYREKTIRCLIKGDIITNIDFN